MTAFPPVPKCPAWCESAHPASGWDEVDRAGDEIAGVDRVCQQSVAVIVAAVCSVEVILQRWAGADCGGGVWSEVYVWEPVVTLSSDADPSSLRPRDADALSAALSAATKRAAAFQ